MLSGMLECSIGGFLQADVKIRGSFYVILIGVAWIMGIMGIVQIKGTIGIEGIIGSVGVIGIQG